MKKNKSNKIDFKKSLVNALSLVIGLGTVGLYYVILKFNVLPTKYLIPVLIVVALLAAGMIYWLQKSKGNASKVIAFVLSILLVIGVTQIARVQSFMKKIAGAEFETHIMQVIVMDDSPYEDIKDFKDLDVLFGANMAQDEENINKVKEEISKKEGFDIEIDEFTQYISLVDYLYSGETEVIILSEAHAALFEEHKPNFDTETRVIATYHFKEVVEKKDYDTDVTKDTYSIFVTGIDTFGPISSVSRSDLNMVMTVNPQTNQILLTSIPRDYHVKLHSFGAYDKLTHAGIYGVNESVKTLEDLFSSQVDEKIDIDYYLRVNFTSVVNIVDSLGGVEVNSRHAFNSVSGHYFQAGPNHVNGTQALGFVRERYNLPDGDFSRIQNQQALITGVLNKAMSPAIITNYGSFLNSIGDGFELSMSDSDMNKVIKQQLNTMSGWDIIQIQLQGTGAHSTSTYSMPGWNLYVAEPKYETVKSAAELITRMENGERISAEDYGF